MRSIRTPDDDLEEIFLRYYYAGNDPIGHGVDVAHLGVLLAASIALTAVAVLGLSRRDLRK